MNGVKSYYLAIDIGASSGRHILGWIEQGEMKLKEVYRFDNKMKVLGEKMLWDLERLFLEILTGMKRCVTYGMIPKSVSIDTWGIDYVLLDKKDKILGETYGYRDPRTKGMGSFVEEMISEQELYERTGIQKQSFNTSYQLMACKKQTPHILEEAKTFLMLPDYFHFRLTGEKMSEYTNATSTQLVNSKTKQWDYELIDKLGYPKEIFLPLEYPQKMVGNLKKDIQTEVGFNCEVMLCCSHDTASAVVSVPDMLGNGAYLSSGTWSLLGIETKEAFCDEYSRKYNFTNEGGYDGKIRYLKNIMGLWMIQCIQAELEVTYSFQELCQMAQEIKEMTSFLDVNDSRFLAPKSMITEIQDYCRETRQRIPKSAGELAKVVYDSLALAYQKAMEQIETRTSQKIESLYIIGGGSKATYLNQQIANITRKTVYAGASEATAIGNLCVQMIGNGEITDKKEARELVCRSFPLKKYVPSSSNE